MARPLKAGIIIESNTMLREGLVRVLSEATKATFFGFASLEELASKPPTAQPELLLVDFSIATDTAAQGVESLRQLYSDAAIVVLAPTYLHTQLVAAIRAGASGYILTDTNCETLIKSLELILLGERVIPRPAIEILMAKEVAGMPALPATLFPPKTLSTREVDILKGLSNGMSNKIIARQWGISEATVKVHVKSILRKIHARNRTEAARWAWHHGVLHQSRTADDLPQLPSPAFQH